MSLYDVLRVPKNANRTEIERSYRSLARSYYPSHDNPSSSDFVEVNKAYTILKDKHKRNFYDVFGAMSIELLLHNKDAYILTRILDRLNIYLYLAAFAIYLWTFLLLPFLVANQSEYGIGFTLMVSPFVVGGVIVVIPITRSLIALYGVYGMGPELKSVFFGSSEVFITTLHVFNCSLYFDNFVSNPLISIAVFLILETLSLASSLYYQTGPERLVLTSGRDMITGKLIRLAIFCLLISSIPGFIKPGLCIIQLGWMFHSRRRPVLLTVFMLSPFFLYFSTFSLILAGFTNLLIYVPLMLLIALVAINLGYGLLVVIKNIPKSKYDRKGTLALPYYEDLV